MGLEDRRSASLSTTHQPARSGPRDLTIAGIVKGKAEHVDTNFLLFQYAYFDETRSFGKDTIGWMIRATSPDAQRLAARPIDAMFANSTAENLDRHRKGVRQGVRSAVRQHRADRVAGGGAAFVTILMIVGNTMALSIRERTREIGVLKTLGFSGRGSSEWCWAIRVAGAARRIPGLAIAALIAMALRNSLASIAPLVSPAIVLQGLALMIALGLITGIIPALNAMRLKLQPRSDGDRHAFALASSRGLPPSISRALRSGAGSRSRR